MKVVFVLALAALVSAGPNRPKVADIVVKNVKWEPSPRIINGHEAVPHSLPYMVHLLFVASSSAWMCGGALISENYILTATHCGRGAERVYVTLGVHNTSAAEPTQVKQTVPGANIRLHEEYGSDSVANDIAVIRLNSPVSLTDAIQIVGLPTRADVENDYLNAVATASGWGLTDGYGVKVSDVLNYIVVRVISDRECRDAFAPVIPPKTLCTSGEHLTSVCAGDSGSPLVRDGVVIGVSAFVSTHCQARFPSGWTRVTDFLDWIANNTDVEIANK